MIENISMNLIPQMRLQIVKNYGNNWRLNGKKQNHTNFL